MPHACQPAAPPQRPTGFLLPLHTPACFSQDGTVRSVSCPSVRPSQSSSIPSQTSWLATSAVLQEIPVFAVVQRAIPPAQAPVPQLLPAPVITVPSACVTEKSSSVPPSQSSSTPSQVASAPWAYAEFHPR